MCVLCKFLRSWNSRYDSEKYPPTFYCYFLNQIESTQDSGEIFDYVAALLGWKIGNIKKGNETNFTLKVHETPFVRVGEDLEFRKHKADMAFLSECLNFKKGLMPGVEFFKCITETRRILPGLILPVFVLHCLRPEEYPIIDQHVWRAMKALSSSPAVIDQEPKSWEDYQNYVAFFNDLIESLEGVEHEGYDRIFVDRALWAFGKELLNSPQSSEVSYSMTRCSFCNRFFSIGWASKGYVLCPSCTSIKQMDLDNLCNRYIEDSYYAGLIPEEQYDFDEETDEHEADVQTGENEEEDKEEEELPVGYEDILHPEGDDDYDSDIKE